MTVYRLKKFLILLLLIDALLVYILQINSINAWLLICLYWAILTIKNAFDVRY